MVFQWVPGFAEKLLGFAEGSVGRQAKELEVRFRKAIADLNHSPQQREAEQAAYALTIRAEEQLSRVFLVESTREWLRRTTPPGEMIALHLRELCDIELAALLRITVANKWPDAGSGLERLAYEAERLRRQALSAPTIDTLAAIIEQACQRLGALADRRQRERTLEQASPRVKRLVALVHGTWPRGFIRWIVPAWSKVFGDKIAWFDEGSDFRTELLYRASRDEVDVEFLPFEWSGNNSVLARATAATQLSAVLKARIERDGKAQHVIIAHSHGGNVALRAVELLEGDMASKLRIVTLATPFLQVHKNHLGRLYFLTAAVIYSAVPIYFAMKVGKPLAEHPERILLGFMLADWWARVVVGFLLSVSIYSLYKLYRLCRWFVVSDYSMQEKANALIKAINYDARNYPPILVLKGVRDEAALALAVGSFLTLMSRIFGPELLQTVRTSLVLGVAIVAIPPLAVILSAYSPTWVVPNPTLEYFLLELPFQMAMLLLLLRLIEILGRTFFGREMAFASDLLELDVSAIPDCSNNVEVQTLGPEFGERNKGLRHGVYSHGQSLFRIHDWLQRVPTGVNRDSQGAPEERA
jgi:hypothetical protein